MKWRVIMYGIEKEPGELWNISGHLAETETGYLMNIAGNYYSLNEVADLVVCVIASSFSLF
jgi:hypothetical protein